MARVIVADADVVIAASNPAHVHHQSAQRIVRQYGRDQMVLHSLTMAEVLVGPARMGNEWAARRRLRAAGFILSPEGEPEPEALARVRASAQLKMPDACVLGLAEHVGVPLATFDKRLASAAHARGVSVIGLDDGGSPDLT